MSGILEPAAALSDFFPLPEGEAQYPIEFIEATLAIKLREDEERVQVGVCSPDDPVLLERLRSFHRKKETVFHPIDRAELSGYLSRKLSAVEPAGAAEKASLDYDRLLLDKLANDAPIVNLVNSLLIEAIRAGASDVHIESFARDVWVRYRIDGVLQGAGRLEREKFAAIASRIKIMANLNIMERRLPQDGRITVNLAGEAVDLRISVVPIADGESIVMRLFNNASSLLSLDELGFTDGCLQSLRRIVRRPHGLVLVSGPTGSGKTTTLNAILREIRTEARKIITIEDPIEYRIEGIDQIQTRESIGLTFASLLRRVLRQDPDIIMVGEIRDSETAELAVRAALTGHLVLSTLHTNDAVSAVARLADMGVEPYLIAGVLRGVLAQRLVRRLCPACRREEEPTGLQLELLRAAGLEGDLERDRRPARLYRGAGCPACHGTGFRGRLAIGEAFTCDPTLEALIASRTGAGELAGHLRGRGLVPMAVDGLRKALEGLTTVEEVERVSLLV